MTDATVVEETIENPPVQSDGKDSQREEMEARARRMGWHPKEEFRGPPDKWRDADEFLRVAETEVSVLRERNKRLDSRVASLEQKIDHGNKRLDEAAKLFEDFRDQAAVNAQEAYRRGKREAEEKLREAARNADEHGVIEAQREIENLERTRPPEKKAAVRTETPPPPQVRIDPAVPAWINHPDRYWYRTDGELAAVAQAYHGYLLQSRPDLSLADNLDEVDRHIRRIYADRFPQARRAEQQPVQQQTHAAVSMPSGGTRAASRTVDAKFAALPADARAAFAKFNNEFKAKGYKEITKEEWLSQYGEES